MPASGYSDQLRRPQGAGVRLQSPPAHRKLKITPAAMDKREQALLDSADHMYQQQGSQVLSHVLQQRLSHANVVALA